MELDTGMRQEERTVVAGALAKLLADCYLLYLKTQNSHWNLMGSEFYALHLLFEKQYKELADAIDEIAERIRALGFFVEATTSAFRNLSSIPEEGKLLSRKEMLEHLIHGHEVVIKEARRLSQIADKERDAATVDMMGKRLNAHEKAAWMLRSQL